MLIISHLYIILSADDNQDLRKQYLWS